MKKLHKTLLSSCLAASMLLPNVTLANDEANKFSDVAETDWFASYVTAVCDSGVFKGTSETTFEPESPLTRAMFATALARLSGADVSEFTETSFTDIEASEWYAPYAEWAFKNGITSGTEEGIFSPEETVTRQQAAAFISRFLESNGYIASNVVSTKYTDADSVADYAKTAVTVCTNAGILKGNADKTFLPENNITRAEAAAVMVRINEFIKDNSKTYDLNEYDKENIILALKTVKMPVKTGADLVKEIYTNAFSSKTVRISGSASQILDKVFALGENKKDEVADITAEIADLQKMVAPSLYGGSETVNETGRYFGGEKKSALEKADFVIGDVLVYENDSLSKISMYDGENFVEMNYELSKESFETSVKTAVESKRFVVLRPSYSFAFLNHFNEPVTNLTKEQAAVVGTAETYLLRGYRVQYDDGHISPKSEYRWQHSVKAPEEYTRDSWGYTNCAAFVHDVYLYALNHDTNMWRTADWIKAEDAIRPFYYEPTLTETEAEKKAVEEKFLSTLQPGDIIVYRYGTSSGHAMLYAGNGRIIHSSGSTFSYDNMREVYEMSIRQISVNDFFSPEYSRYIFGGTIKQLGIVRPLNTWEGEIPENTTNRITTMSGIMAEKYSSHNGSKTVNPGEEMTFTFHIQNTNNNEVKLEVSDVVPENTTYVSGAEKSDGKNLSWNVTVPANEAVEVSYTVKVNNDPALINNAYVYSEDGKVGGVSFKCGKVEIKRTLTADEQAKIDAAAKELKDSELPAFDLANEIYKKALGVEKILPGEKYTDIPDGVFFTKEFDGDTTKYYSLGCYDIRREGIYSEMVVHPLYGGRNAFIEPLGTRTRLLREIYLTVGDIVLSRTIDADNLYIYTSEGLMDLNNGTIVEDARKTLDSMMGKYPDNYDYYFVVLRPSMILE